MQKSALIFLAEGFEEIEAVTCIDILRRAAVEVTIAGLSANPVVGSRGVRLNADQDVDSVDETFDAYVLPGGGPGAVNLARCKKVQMILRDAERQGKIIAAICASPAVVLSPLGLLKNKSATCYPGMQKDFPSDAHFMPEAVVVDGNLITSRGPATAMEFALTMVEHLAGPDVRHQVARATLAG